jgi:orotidine-5'-phosphate decarboxylase
VTGRDRIVAALDVPDPSAAAELARKLDGHVGMVKVGLELFVAHGKAAVDAVKTVSLPVFLDLKLHDIPNTVEAAARGAAGLGAALLTVHASGGAAMIRAAMLALARLFDGPPELNLWVRTAPRGAEQFHWHVDIAPRLTIKAGFELGTGVDINVYPPERAASDLRECL